MTTTEFGFVSLSSNESTLAISFIRFRRNALFIEYRWFIIFLDRRYTVDLFLHDPWRDIYVPHQVLAVPYRSKRTRSFSGYCILEWIWNRTRIPDSGSKHPSSLFFVKTIFFYWWYLVLPRIWLCKWHDSWFVKSLTSSRGNLTRVALRQRPQFLRFKIKHVEANLTIPKNNPWIKAINSSRQ